MREIKFRGKRLDNDAQTGPADGWVTGFYYQGLCEGKVRHFIASCPCVWEVDPATVGQYTGLKDKNGKEIWEDDIARVPETDFNAEIIGRVIYEDGSYYIIPLNGGHLWGLNWSLRKHNAKIIGNFHDNPELQKGGE